MTDGLNLPSSPEAAASRAVPLRKRFAVAVASAMGISAIGQALAFFRQVLIAAFFGISRDLDIYLMAYVIANMVVFAFGIIFDSVAVPRYVQLKEQKGEKAAHALATAVFRLSWLVAIAASAAMLVVVWLLAPLIATGFNAAERSALSGLAWYFLPWTLLFVPYYAAGARHKGKRNFNRVFAAEIVIGCLSIACLALWHGSIESVPLAYAAGYCGGLLILIPGSGLLQRTAGHGSLRALLRNAGELFLVNQTGNIPSIVDRHFQSLIPAGGIASVGYSTQLVNGLSTLLLFREIFVVPLSETGRRTEKLQRLILGLLLLAVPVATFIAFFAPEVVQILYNRGRFDATAAVLTADVLRIYVMTLITSLVGTPLFRMFTIVDRIGYAHIGYFMSSVGLAAFGYVFVEVLGLGAPGVAAMLLGNSILSVGVTAVLLARAGITLDWARITGYLLFAMAVSGVGALAAVAAASPLGIAWARLGIGVVVFSVVVMSSYFAIRARLRHIISS